MEASAPGNNCHLSAGLAIKAFATALQAQAINGQVPLPVILRLSEALSKEPGPLARHYATVERLCCSSFALQQMDRQRTNYVGRIAVKTFSHLMADPLSGIDRRHLGSFFSALRMILGEKVYSDLQETCRAIIATLPPQNGSIAWTAFYGHPDIVLILERIQVAVARTLRRFEPRKDWFLIVMNTNPTSQSLGSTAFVTKGGPASKSVQDFSEANLMRLLEAMFANVRPAAMSDGDKAGFLNRWGVSVETVFGQLLVEITRRQHRERIAEASESRR
jgi:hypothetical protein